MTDRRSISRAICAVALCICTAPALSSCVVSDAPLPKNSPEATAAVSTVIPTSASASTPSVTDTADRYEIDYHIAPPLLVETVGEDVICSAQTVTDAFLEGISAAYIGTGYDEVYFELLRTALHAMCPPFFAFTSWGYDSYDAAAGILSWETNVSCSELSLILAGFSDTVAEYMSEIRKGDIPEMRAALIYHAFTLDAAYDSDTDAVSDAELVLRTSAYNAITNHTGICTSFSFGLAFLFAQAGIDCVPVKSTGAPLGDHGMTLVNFDGKYSYCDATWDMGGTFQFFCSSSEERSDFFPPETMSMYDGAPIPYTVYDGRFDTLHGRFYDFELELVDHERQLLVFRHAEGVINIDID